MAKFFTTLHCSLALEKGKLTVATMRAEKRCGHDKSIVGRYNRMASDDGLFNCQMLNEISFRFYSAFY